MAVEGQLPTTMSNDTLLCSDASWVFESFDRLAHCFHIFGGTAGSNSFTGVVNNCLNDYCQSPYTELGGCGNWSAPTPLNFTVNNKGYYQFTGYAYFENPATCLGVNGDVNADIAGPGASTLTIY